MEVDKSVLKHPIFTFFHTFPEVKFYKFFKKIKKY